MRSNLMSRSRHGSAAAAAASSDNEVTPATHGGGSWLQPGDACALKRTSGQAWARCRPGSFCACSCVAGIPVGGNDTFSYIDPEGTDGPGVVSVSVLDNDASPDGSPVSIAPGSVESLTPGVTVTSVDEAQGIINIDIPDATPSVELTYVVASSSGMKGGLAHVFGTPGTAYPAGTCLAGSKCSATGNPRAPALCKNNKGLTCNFQSTATCAAATYAKPNPSDTYCMANFRATCANPANAGCNRCAIYKVMQACAAQSSPWPTPSQKPEEACRYHSTAGNYVIVKSRTADPSQKTQAEKDPERGTNLCIMPNHYILMPTAACTGVDDKQAKCTGPTVEYWDGAVRHGYNSGAGDLGFGPNKDWAVMINAPDERGQHQMHIHVALLDPTTKTNVLIVAKEDNNMETDLTKPPTQHTVNKHTVAAYFFKDTTTPPTSLKKLDVFSTAAVIHAKFSKTPNQQSYGVALIPKKGGYVVAATYGFADVNVMDTKVSNSPKNKFCEAACAPFK
ncbi:hypothetical protein OEZ86_002150 [Tetradesmus obliquus]|nr:hypothetical protein OEZ86_002150 [Tetradesmus obliquus]